jgi:hypothetical protein
MNKCTLKHAVLYSIITNYEICEHGH